MIVAIGDSITAGQYLAAGEQPWPALIHGHELVARGVPSDTTRMALERFPADVQSFAPDAVVIQFGHNDANRWATDRGLPRVSPDAFAANLAEMVERCHAFGATPFLCTLTPSLRSEAHTAAVGLYDEMLREVSEEHAVELIDVRTIFETAEAEDAPLLLPDGLHLSPAGHRVYAAAVQRSLDAWSAR